MVNFLNRLAARALGATAIAEPVIPARFSPGSEPAASFASQTTQTSSEISEEPRHPLHTPAAEPYPYTEAPADPPGPSLQSPDDARHLIPPRLSRALHPHDRLAPYAELDTAQPSLERTHAREQRPAPAIPVEPKVAPSGELGESSQKPASPAPFAQPRPAPRLSPLSDPTRSPAPQHPHLSSTLRPAPPTVRVSIGRIEVRAELASPPPKAPAPRPTPSTLSLDQFLKQAGRSAR